MKLSLYCTNNQATFLPLNVMSTLPCEPHPDLALALTRRHFRRLREVYRSAGWPSQDTLEIELLASGLLARVTASTGHESLRVTDAGMLQLAQTLVGNRAMRSAHEALVERVALEMGRAGRLVWRGLALRAQVPAADDATSPDASPHQVLSDNTPNGPHTANIAQRLTWVVACPDVFLIRNTSVEGYLEPIVHEIKVSRADLLGDLKKPSKRSAYLGMGGECWYVLGQSAKGNPIAQPQEVPLECGVLLCEGDRLVVARPAPRRVLEKLPFHVWMALAKAGPAVRGGAEGQAGL